MSGGGESLKQKENLDAESGRPPRHLARGPRALPRYVVACLEEKWHLRLFNKDTQEVLRIPYRCNSWRCSKCGGKIARRDYRRTFEAFNRHEQWAFMVLTLDVDSFKKRNLSNQFAYKIINYNLVKLRQRIERKYGSFDFVRVVERTPSNSFPHVNVVFHCKELFEQFQDDDQILKWNKRWLTGNAKQCGFGIKHTITFARNKQAVASYLGKTGLFSTIAKEVSKQSQVPFDAPPHFRRIGATRGLLPALNKLSDNVWTGELIRGPIPEKINMEVDYGSKEANAG
jgi:hypothetical protein